MLPIQSIGSWNIDFLFAESEQIENRLDEALEFNHSELLYHCNPFSHVGILKLLQRLFQADAIGLVVQLKLTAFFAFLQLLLAFCDQRFLLQLKAFDYRVIRWIDNILILDLKIHILLQYLQFGFLPLPGQQLHQSVQIFAVFLAYFPILAQCVHANCEFLFH